MKKELTFPEITLRYLSHLSKNNNKEWFEANRDRYTSEFLEPAIHFVILLGEKLSKISPELHFIPKIDKSIFRLYRDVRFSKNKSPFKTNLGVFLWEGSGKRMECSAYYFHLEPGSFFLGTGMYEFTKEQLKIYRDKISEPEQGKELNNIINRILKNKNFKLGGRTFKRIPKGYDPSYKYADLLLHSGLYTFYESKNLSELREGALIDYCFSIFRKQNPLQKWLVENIAS